MTANALFSSFVFKQIDASAFFKEKFLQHSRRYFDRLQQVLEKITPEQLCSLSYYNFIFKALFYATSS